MNRDEALAEIVRLKSPMPCGHPWACHTGQYEWDDEPKCAACEEIESAIRRRETELVKIAERGAYVVHGEAHFPMVKDLGFLIAHEGASIYFENMPTKTHVQYGLDSVRS